MPKMKEYFTIDKATPIAFSDKAVLITVDGEKYWLPFSQVEDPDEQYIREAKGLEIEIVIPAWMAKEKGLIG